MVHFQKAAIAGVLLTLGLGGAARADGAQEVGMHWTLVAVDGAAPGYAATLSLDQPGWLRGQAPCNSFSARLTGEPGAPLIDGIRSTKMACDDLPAELAFFDLLSAMTALANEGPQLVLTGPDHEMRFDPAPAP